MRTVLCNNVYIVTTRRWSVQLAYLLGSIRCRISTPTKLLIR